MKKLLFLFTALVFISCSGDDNEEPQNNVLIIGGQEYQISEGLISIFEASDGEENTEISLGQISWVEFYLNESPYRGVNIDIYYKSDDGTGNFNSVVGDYDLTNNSVEDFEDGTDYVETWVGFGHWEGSTPPTTLSVSKSENSYTIELKTSDENGNDVELYYNGNLAGVFD